MTAREHRQNAVLDSGRQRVGPFVYGLVGDPDRRRRRGDRPAEQLDCFGLDHAVLNHSSALIATMVPGECAAFAAMAETTYAQRLAAALGVPVEKGAWDAGARRKALALAAELRVSRQAVEKFFRDASGSMSAEDNARAARYLRVSAYWLATGDGPMRDALAWPFGADITPDEFARLGPSDVQPAVDVLRAALARCVPPTAEPPEPAEPTTAGGLPVPFVERRVAPPQPAPTVTHRRGVRVIAHPQADDPDVFPPPRPGPHPRRGLPPQPTIGGAKGAKGAKGGGRA